MAPDQGQGPEEAVQEGQRTIGVDGERSNPHPRGGLEGSISTCTDLALCRSYSLATVLKVSLCKSALVESENWGTVKKLAAEFSQSEDMAKCLDRVQAYGWV